jgi:copper chaperone NosL
MNQFQRPSTKIDARRGAAQAAVFSLMAAVALWLCACRQALLQPVEIQPEDVCARCKMAISERRYASEFVTKGETAYKFDDIACMLRVIQERHSRGDIAAVFVVDYPTRRWINALEAWFVRSQSLKTPMGGGIVAFQDQPRAEAAVLQFHGELLRFGDLNH